jgi:serine/threonine-protein kinase
MAKPPSFEIVRVLGSGGMGDVYLAQMSTPSGDQLVALKRIRPGLLSQAKVLSQFQRECRIGAMLQDEHIVGLKAHGQDKEGPYMAMEYVDGVPASLLVQAATADSPNLPIAVALSIARDAALGLSRAHAFVNAEQNIAGVIHRDVSPENILVGKDGVAKVSDFGIAKARGGTAITETGTVKGKFPYMAPELFHGAEGDVQTDVFAFGATLFWLLCGVAPFHGRTEADTIRAVLYSAPARASSLVAGVPPEIDAWISSALEKDRALRPKDLRAIAALLEAHRSDGELAGVRGWVERALAIRPPARAEWGEVASTKRLRRATPQQQQQHLRSLPRVAAVAAGVGLVVGLGLFFGLRPAVEPARVAAPMPAPVAAPVPEFEKSEPLPAVTPKAELAEPSPPKPATVAPTRALASVTRSKAKTGKLRVKVMPWAEAFVNGAHVGKTPFAPLTLAEGTHSVILVNNELKVRKQYAVKVTGGKETVLKVELTAE